MTRTKTAVLEIADLATAGTLERNGDGPEELLGEEYVIDVTIEGRAPLLMHRYDTEAVKQKGAAAKNSKEKKSDNIESYVYRDSDGYLGIEAAAIIACLSDAARSMQDPRSPRKSLRDLVRAGIRVEPFVTPLLPKTKTWHYVDRRRVVVQRNAITRERPAFREGWTIKFRVVVLAGEYLNKGLVQDLIQRAGRFTGLLDGRPLFGLFRVTSFKVGKLND